MLRKKTVKTNFRGKFMLSVMSIQIVTLSQTLTDGGVALSKGTLEFSNYSKDGAISTSLSYEAYGATAVALMDARIGSNGIAVGYVDSVNKLPVFKIQTFAPISLSSVVGETEETVAVIPCS